MAQRLVRTLCPHCKGEGEISPSDWHALVAPWKAPLPKKVLQAEGCLECRNTGYLGRQGLYEILPVTQSVAKHIKDDADITQLRHAAMREGMRTLRLSGAQKIAAGLTTMEEVLRVAPPIEQ